MSTSSSSSRASAKARSKTRDRRGFANLVGAIILGASVASYAAGMHILRVVLGVLVATLALLAAATGFCTGCEVYKYGSLLLGRPFVSCPIPPRPR